MPLGTLKEKRNAMEVFFKKKWILLAAGLIIAVAAFYGFSQSAKQPISQDNPFALEKEEELSQKNESETKDEEAEPLIMKVDVKGEVRAPGVFSAQKGERVIDLIEKAGNFTTRADGNQVNLAQLVEDQMVIYVPKKGEEVILANPSPVTAGSQNDGQNGGPNSSQSGQINLNSATQAELETLTGIGPSKALAIMEYRDTKGEFKQVEDLKNVSGIGEKTFEKLKDSVSVK